MNEYVVDTEKQQSYSKYSSHSYIQLKLIKGSSHATH